MTYLGWMARLGIAIVAGFVLFRLAPVVLDEWRGLDACPKLGPLPACYLVSACYSAMAIAALIAPRRLAWLFAVGWLPVFGLAISGSILEVLGRPTCPVTSSGTPMCYYSLTVAVLLIPAFFAARATTNPTGS